MTTAMDKFGISLASAATHYNHSLRIAQHRNPADVEGLIPQIGDTYL